MNSISTSLALKGLNRKDQQSDGLESMVKHYLPIAFDFSVLSKSLISIYLENINSTIFINFSIFWDNSYKNQLEMF